MRKKLAYGMIAVMAVATLAGCGKKGEGGTSGKDGVYSAYVKLCDYKGVEATVVTFDVTDEEVQEQVEANLYEYADYTEVTDRAVQNDDYVSITYKGKLDGEDSEDYSGEEEEYQIGEGSFFEEAEKALVGASVGDTISTQFKLTEDSAFDEADAGKTVSMDITLNAIFKESLPEYNEEFVKENTDFSSVKEYEKSIKEELLQSKEEEYKSAATEEIMSYIVENSEFDGYPEELYEQCRASYEASNATNAEMFGMELQEFLDAFGIDEEAQKEDILLDVHYELVARAIAEAEGIKVSDSEAKDYVSKNYEDYGYASEEEFNADYTIEEVKDLLTYEKVMQFLYDKADRNEISEDEYLKESEEE